MWTVIGDSMPDQGEREYQNSHPWLTFTFVPDRNPALWLLLGEAQSKCEHIAGVPLLPETARELHQVFLAKGAAATTAIEGNTLSEAEVRELMEGRLKLPPSKEYLGREVENMLRAFNFIADELMAGGDDSLRPGMILDYNNMVLDGLELEEGVLPGAWRQHSVLVAGYRGAPSQDCPYLIERLCDWLNSPGMKPAGNENRIVYAILRAVLAHLYLAWIHPFGDGNGRIARLVEFQILVAAGIPTPAAHLLSNHYNQTRSEYYRQLARASRVDDGVSSFLFYAVRGFVDQARIQIESIRFQQMEVTWRNHVHNVLPGHGLGDARRRSLVFDLSTQPGPVPRGRLRSISAKVAESYLSKGLKTLSRDLNALTQLGLIHSTPQGYETRHHEVVAAFMPRRRPISETESQGLA